jgi:integrase
MSTQPAGNLPTQMFEPLLKSREATPENAYEDSGSSPPRANVSLANHQAPLRGQFSAMARRRFQNPKPFREGNWWWMNIWQDEAKEGRITRKRKRMKVCPASTPEREARKIANEMLRPMNQGLQTIGSATQFAEYVNGTYKPVVLPLLASTTKASYEGTLEKYLIPVFGDTSLRDMSTLNLQGHFSRLGGSSLSGATVLKIKEVLSSVLSSAVGYELLAKNPMLSVRIPRNKVVNKKKKKPHLTPEEFEQLVNTVEEPYSTMIYVAVHSGLRVSELIGLKWEDVHDGEGAEAITVDERCCRGDWSVTKTVASSTTIPVDSSVTDRIRRLKSLEVEVRWGGSGAKRRIKLVRSDGPQDLVFQSLRKGAPMRDGNILRRHLRPAALKLGIDPKKATWRSLRTSCATWMIEAGANLKDTQAQMRHERLSTTMDIYAQHVPSSQRRAVNKTMEMVRSRQVQKHVPITFQNSTVFEDVVSKTTELSH